MVATIHKLTVDLSDPRSVAERARYYTRAEYYQQSSESTGQWFGQGAAALGLKGAVSGRALRRLFLGRSPDGTRQLVKVRRRVAPEKEATKQPETHVPGFDLTFSVPKTVSTLWALSEEALRRLIDRAIDEAARETLTWLEQNLELARRGKGGRHHDVAKLVVAMFDHSTTRALEPGLHRHCVILNLCQGRDRKWSKVSSRELFRWFRTSGPMFRNTLLLKLRDYLGVEGYRPALNDKPASWFELRGVSETLADHWSSRRKEILADAELSHGNCSTAQARQNANLRTRRPKGELPSTAELDRQWQKEAAALGVTPQSQQGALARFNTSDIEQCFEQAIADATRVCLADRAYFSRPKFLQAVSEAMQDVPVSGVEVARRADAALLRLDLFHAIETKQNREPVYTSQEMWKLEQKLLKTVDRLQQGRGAKVSATRVHQALKTSTDLSDEQAKAAELLLGSSGQIRCMTGVAGSGKTRTLNVVRNVLEKAGYTVVGTALSGAAKEELATKARIETRTVASYQHHLSKSARERFLTRAKHEIRMFYRAALGKKTWRMTPSPKLDKRTVLFVDEAGMLDTKSMHFLVQAAQKSGATLLLVGDPKQLSPIGPGGPFKRIIETAPTSHLAENFRQKHAPEDAQAAADLRSGRVDRMLESYLRRGQLTVTGNRYEAAQQLVNAWSKDGNAKRPEQAIILTQTLDEARHINRLCQAERRLAGELGHRSVRLQQDSFHVGDRVLFHKPLRPKGIENGYQATITAIHPVTQEISFRLDRPPSAQQKKLGRTQTVKLKPADIGPEFLTLGYAATTHKMQGQSRERAYCLMGGRLTNQELAYVQVTRGERSTKLFIDRDHAGRKLSELAEALRTSGEKKLAHDLGLRLRIKKEGQHS